MRRRGPGEQVYFYPVLGWQRGSTLCAWPALTPHPRFMTAPFVTCSRKHPRPLCRRVCRTCEEGGRGACRHPQARDCPRRRKRVLRSFGAGTRNDDPVVAMRILKHLRTSRPDSQPHCPVHTLVHAGHLHARWSGRLRTFAVPAHRPAAAVIGSTQTRADKVASKQQSVSFIPRARARCLPATALAPLRSARASICA